MSKFLFSESLKNAISYEQYYALTNDIIASPNPPAPYNEEKMLKYTADNYNRMTGINREIAIDQKLYNLMDSLTEEWLWVVISEPWCGDASQSVPALAAIAACSQKVELKIVLRDSNMDVMDAYLTNNGRSIPKLICVRKEDMEELGTWGPRPAPLQEIVLRYKDMPDMSMGQKINLIHDWYKMDKTIMIQQEFIQLVKDWKSATEKK
jgi:hypothetical protein